MIRVIININGAIQGVGFRPFVFRIAKALDIKGYISNSMNGVIIDVEADQDKIDSFIHSIYNEKPSLCNIFSLEITYCDPIGYDDFQIRESSKKGKRDVSILPDIATCSECISELFDPSDRRFHYPFINCTNCGPRFTILKSLPYDRDNTTMGVFKMCDKCSEEYYDINNRRFHAQPNACSVCGPYVSLYNKEGFLVSEKDDAIQRLIDEIINGRIVAIKGIGGFHLVCDARNEEAVIELRNRKRRQEKPFAVMFPNIDSIKEYAHVSMIEEALLLAPTRPIVILKKREGCAIAPSVAPNLDRIGAFLPYSPIHHIILGALNFPIVATSGNISDEPIIKDNDIALKTLINFSDYILIHNRDIQNRCDDSVLKIIGGFPTFIRRSRGYAPMPIKLPIMLKRNVLAVGGFYKNTFSIGFDDKVIISQHIGDVETLEAINYFEEAVSRLCSLYEFRPDLIVHDLHLGYETTKWAISQRDVKKIGLQHHHAHIISCMAENNILDEVIGISWDGTGYGEDGTLWGGEFLRCSYTKYERIAQFKQIRLLGGEKAIKEPRRIALSMLFEIFQDGCFNLSIPTLNAFDKMELKVLYEAWQRGINSPYTSSAGRIFDGVASLIGIIHKLNYEGQAAMMIEDLYNPGIKETYPYTIKDNIIDWSEIIKCIILENDKRVVPSRFINTLADIIYSIVKKSGIKKVCLSGGVFQNDPLVKKTIELLSEEFQIFTNKRIPPNDGGISFGQAIYGGLVDLDDL